MPSVIRDLTDPMNRARFLPFVYTVALQQRVELKATVYKPTDDVI